MHGERESRWSNRQNDWWQNRKFSWHGGFSRSINAHTNKWFKRYTHKCERKIDLKIYDD